VSERRWNPILREWVITATHRQDRTFLPPRDYCPLCPTLPDASVPTEVPAATYEIVVFENRFPSLHPVAPEAAIEATELYPVAPANGVCEVVLYTADHDSTLADRSVEEIDQLIQVWTDRSVDLASRADVEYVMPFENKGAIIGVTLTHPHGQIYAFPFVPPKIAREFASGKAHREATGSCLFCDVVEEELRDGRRVIWENTCWVAFVPFYARWPYEVHVYAKAHVLSLANLTEDERYALAEALKAVLLKYDNLWNFSMPYLMAVHQAPCGDIDASSFHLHVEFYPPHRTPVKLKYLASVETSAGTFINDTLPEETAATLRAVLPHGVPDLAAVPLWRTKSVAGL